MNGSAPKFLSLPKAATASGLTVKQLQRLCRGKQVVCQKIAGEWFIEEASLHSPVARKAVRSSQDLRTALASVLSIALILGGLWQLQLTSQSGPASQPASVGLSQEVDARNLVATTFGATLSSAAENFPSVVSLLGQQLVINWQNFLGLRTTPTPTTPSPESVIADPALRVLVDNLIKEGVQKELSDLPKQIKIQPGVGGKTGMIVVPSTGNAVNDAELRRRLQEVFSDKVTIKIDPTGVSGVITPVFNKVPSNDYLFLLAPLKNN